MTQLTDEDESPVIKALIEFTGCIGGSFTDVCSYALIPGDAYIPFTPDDDGDSCDDEDCSQVWVRVANAGVARPAQEGWDESCSTSLMLDLEVGIMRCMEVVEKGEAPTGTALLGYAMQAMDDMNTIMCAAMNCEVWTSISMGQWTPIGPMGGEFGGQWTMSVQVD